MELPKNEQRAILVERFYSSVRQLVSDPARMKIYKNFMNTVSSNDTLDSIYPWILAEILCGLYSEFSKRAALEIVAERIYIRDYDFDAIVSYFDTDVGKSVAMHIMLHNGLSSTKQPQQLRTYLMEKAVILESEMLRLEYSAFIDKTTNRHKYEDKIAIRAMPPRSPAAMAKAALSKLNCPAREKGADIIHPLCVACSEMTITMIVLPCAHASCCYRCLVKNSRENGLNCPMCRAEIVDVKRIYWA